MLKTKKKTPKNKVDKAAQKAKKDALKQAKAEKKARQEAEEATRKAQEAQEAALKASEAQEATKKAQEAQEATKKASEAQKDAQKAKEKSKVIPPSIPHLLAVYFSKSEKPLGPRLLVNLNTRIAHWSDPVSDHYASIGAIRTMDVFTGEPPVRWAENHGYRPVPRPATKKELEP